MVPVIDKDQKPLMPCSEKRARQMILSKKATPFWKKGIFCIRLNVEPSSRNLQQIAVGIDPGSKKEGFTVKSASHAYLNIQADAITYIKDAIETRRNMRKSRRQRNAPYRKSKINRRHGGLAPSTKARWQWKLNIVKQLNKIFPITDIVVEDIKAASKKGKKKWHSSFSPLETGKKWFYEEISKYGKLTLKQGYETKQLRDDANLIKTKKKLSEAFEAHCVDSWVLVNSIVGGHIKPDNKRILFISQLRFHRRQLHYLQSSKGGIRRNYGGTRSCGFKRGSLVKHPKYGLTYVGGTTGYRISLHSISDGKRLCQNADPKDIKFLTYNTWRLQNSSNE